ncbi:hypothetical protein [Brevundimonas sp. R86498]|uniref:hypothetical protein n=1 Tax=Brevundimonas sp. R86498 TaxID=3093845 RepID=UPI0037CBA673
MTPRLRVVQNPPAPVETDPDETPGDAVAVGPVIALGLTRHTGQPFGPLADNRTTHPQVRERPYGGVQAWGVETDAESAEVGAGSALAVVAGAA